MKIQRIRTRLLFLPFNFTFYSYGQQFESGPHTPPEICVTL